MAPNCCTNCDIKVTQASKALQCQMCQKWSHIRCIGVPESLYEQLVELQLQCLPYICGNCRPKLTDARENSTAPIRKSDQVASSAPPRSSKSKSQKSTPIKKLGTSSCNLSTPCETPTQNTNGNGDCVMLRSSSVTSVLNDQEPWVTVVRKAVKPRVNNMQGEPAKVISKPEKSLSRDNCLIILKAPESQKDSPELRMEDDKIFLQNCITKLFDANEPGLKIIAAYRLGRKREDPVLNPRPLKVVLESKEDCKRVFSRTSRLKGEPYYVVRDLSPEDRERMKGALEELKRRRENGESNLRIVDFRVVSVRPRTRWRPVLLVPNP